MAMMPCFSSLRLRDAPAAQPVGSTLPQPPRSFCRQ
jgi:hypothetical protein